MGTGSADQTAGARSTAGTDRSDGAPSNAPATAVPPRDEPPVLPTVSDDDRDIGWGDDPEASGRGHSERDERWYREQRPPHWE